MIIDSMTPLTDIADHLDRYDARQAADFVRALDRIAQGAGTGTAVDAALPPSCVIAVRRLDALRRLWPDASRRVLAVARDVAETDKPGGGVAGLSAILRAALSFNPLWLSELTPLQNMIAARGGLADLLALLEAADARQPLIPLHLLPMAGVGGIEAARRHQERRARDGVPGVLFNTLPKTGSMYLSEVLLRSLDLPWSTTAISDHALRDRPVRPWLRQLAQGGAFSQEHLPGTPETRAALLACGVDRIVVHIRDPRSAMLSSLHNFCKHYRQTLEIHAPYLPDGFPELPFDDRVEFLVERYFAEQMAWIEDWVAAADSSSELKVLLTQYEQSIDDLHGFVNQVIDFYDLRDHPGVTVADVAPSERLHFRRGSKTEWREAFNADHLARMRAMMPADLMKRFGWPE